MDGMMKPRPRAVEAGQVKQKRYVREEGLSPEDVPSPEVQAQMKRQREYEAADRMEQQAAKTAPTTRSTMGAAFAKGGKVGSASKRADGIASKGKTKGRVC